MKKLLTVVLGFTLLTNHAHALHPIGSDYEFFEGVPQGMFREDTQHDTFVEVPTKQRTDKSTALTPPPVGFFGGNLSSDFINPFYDNEPHRQNTIELSESNFASITTPSPTASDGTINVKPLTPKSEQVTVNKTYGVGKNNVSRITTILAKEDHTIGTLYIPTLNYQLKVYDNARYDTMKKGVGLIEGTSAWDGNVGLAGHNRGSGVTIGKINKLKTNDFITYETVYGKKKYRVVESKIIDVNDTSVLDYSEINQLTLITCIANRPNDRLCVTAVESEDNHE